VSADRRTFRSLFQLEGGDDIAYHTDFLKSCDWVHQDYRRNKNRIGTGGKPREKGDTRGNDTLPGRAYGLFEKPVGQALKDAAAEKDPIRRKELENLASICAQVVEKPARTLDEAVNSMWITWVGCTWKA